MNPQIQNHESMLRESIKHFLTSYHRGSTDFSSFESIFFRLIQTMLDPPLEITWFYSAVTFHAAKSSLQNTPSRVLRAKDLLDLLISCSNLSSATKKIALLAPVVYELYNIVCDSRKSGLCVKMEVDKLVENMVSFVMMSAGVYDYGNKDAEFDNVVVCFEDLVRVWTTDRGGGSCNFGENFRVFFPLLTDENWKVMNSSCGMRELVGIVLCEVFFLRLCLSFGSGICTEDLLKDTRDQAVQTIKGFGNCYFLDDLQRDLLMLAIQTIKGFQNFYFLDMLLKMLLEPSLPTAALMNFEDAALLHKALYDAVILIDYSFYSGRWVQSSESYSKKLALVWVLVADTAIQFARATTDEPRANSYLHAYCESQLVAELVKWANNQSGMMDQGTRPDISTPKALIKWLLLLQDQGTKVFDHSTSVLHSKAVACVSRVEGQSPKLKLPSNKDQEMGELPNNGFQGTLFLGRKRKETLSGLHESRVKQVKRDFCGNSFGEKFLPFSSEIGLHFGNEVKNVASDDDMELVG